MPWRELPGYDWNRIIVELTHYPGGVTLGHASLTDSGGVQTQLILFTVRGGTDLPYVDQYFPGVHLHREQALGGQAAHALLTQRVLSLEIPRAPDGTRATWVTGGDDIGFAAPSPMPSIYYGWGWGADGQTTQAVQSMMDQPLSASGKSYYPTLRDALLEVLLSRTRSLQRPLHPAFYGVVSLAYDRAYLGAVDYVADEGIVVQVVESAPGAAGGYELQIAYQVHPTDQELRRHTQRIDQGGPITIATGAPPLFYWAALLDRGGQLIDQAERRGAPDSRAEAALLSPMALAEALDFLDSAWRNVFSQPLIGRVQLTSAANLTQIVNRRDDFESRLSHLSDLFGAFRIGDDLLRPSSVKQLKLAGSLLRMGRVTKERLSEPDRTSASKAIDELRAIVDLRAALQHKVTPDKRKPDLPTALRRLGIGFPPDWQQAWIEVQLRTVESVAEIRRALLATLPE